MHLGDGMGSRSVDSLSRFNPLLNCANFVERKRVFCIRQIVYNWIESECLMLKLEIG